MLDLAKVYIGIEESSPLVSSFIRETASWLDEDGRNTSWCGCFAAAMARRAGYKPPNSAYRASEWETWGKAVTIQDARPGDVVVFNHHVTILSGFCGKFAECVGGNQSNAVKLSRYQTKNIRTIRRYEN